MGNSFYGGQDARPFVIKNKFSSVEDMVTAFSIGLVYTDVNFEDYVLIETEHKNNPENGMIFRRGYDVNSNRYIDSYEVVSEKVNGVERVVAFVLRENDDRLKAYGAEYIGTIVGPAGGAPHLDFSQEYDKIQTTKGHEDCIVGSFKPKLVSGKTNNEIKGKWYSVRTKDNESTTVFISFEIPYTVFDFTAESISAYNQPTTTRNTKSTNYFYEEWKLGIPKGIKGDSVTDVKLIGDSTKNNQQIQFVVTNYDNSATGSSSTKNFKYNIIDSINLSNEGSLTIGQTAEKDYVSGNVINWIDEIQFDDKKGIFTFTSNNGNIDYSNTDSPINWITGIDFDNTGVFTFTSNNGKIDFTNTTPITWLTNASLSDAGALNFTFNNNTISPVNKTLTWITGISFNENGKLTINFNNNKIANGQFTNSNNLINWITDASISEDGLLNFTFNNNIIDKNGEKTNILERKINWINSISFLESGLFTVSMANEQGIEGEIYANNSVQRWVTWIKNVSLNDNGLLKFTFNNGELDTGTKDSVGRSTLEKTLTWVKSASLNGDTGELNITFNNTSNSIKNIDTTLNWVKSANISDTGLLKIEFVNSNNITVNDSNHPNSITKQITSISSMSLNDTGKFEYQLTNGTSKQSIQIPIINSAEISNGQLTIKYKNGESITASGTLKQISSVTRDVDNNKLVFNYTTNEQDKIDFPQNFYISSSEPSSMSADSIWAIVESF